MVAVCRMNADAGCRVISFGPAKKKNGATISASVGVGGRNAAVDVRTAQELLNSVPTASGGPVPLLAVDGLVGPKTVAAIQRFQRTQLGWADGRVDPGGPTITRLNALTGAKPGPAGAVNAFKGEAASHSPNPILDALRITTMTISVPDAKTAVTKAITTVEQAFSFVMLGGGGLTGNPTSFDTVDSHFLFKDVPRDQTLSELQFIGTTFRRMKAVLDKRASVFGGPMFGPNLFETDPHQDKTDPRVKAYVPLSSVEHTDGLTPHKIYLCRGLDSQTQDRYTHILIHEMGHFVDDETPETEITDHGYAFFGTLKTLPHEKRIHNADTYAIFAFENAFGKERVLKMFPKLR
jgi:Putative peptidoglycan binding domain